MGCISSALKDALPVELLRGMKCEAKLVVTKISKDDAGRKSVAVRKIQAEVVIDETITYMLVMPDNAKTKILIAAKQNPEWVPLTTADTVITVTDAYTYLARLSYSYAKAEMIGKITDTIIHAVTFENKTVAASIEKESVVEAAVTKEPEVAITDEVNIIRL